ncbi:MAG: HAMP domain-containing histidine kinase [Rhodocyclales bacterium]|nr:HAMP domain-containing histidine kinase [Rhodocyclales bacterium]
MVHALALRELRIADLERYADAAAQERFAHTFSVLKNLSGVVRIKVFNRDGIIVWSDEPRLIGKHVTAHEADLGGAMRGETRAIINPADRPSHAEEDLPAQELIEFYVPFAIARPGTAGETVSGAFSLYRSAKELNFTIRRGLALLWVVKGLGGVILFVSLYWLFRTVYRRQRAAESQIARLSSEHERIVQMEKLSAMGQMVGEIAHQFNNPLVGVINLAQRAELQTDNPQRVRELLGEIRRAGEHCSGFVRRMLQFTQMSRSEPQATELGALMQETVAFFRQTVGERPDIVLEAPESPVVIEADPVLLRHAMYNLIHNAAQADPQGPIAVSLKRARSEGISGWELAVADRGPGLKTEVAEKLFTPFFSTRPGGTGLGLSVAQHIAILHGGGIRAEDNPGGGARFVIWLPATGKNDETENTAG